VTNQARVAILSHDDDPHLPFVTQFLTREPLVINTGSIPDRGLDLCFSPGNPWPDVMYKGESLRLDTHPVGSVWYRSVDVRRMLPEAELKRRIAATLSGDHALTAHYRLLDDITGDPGSEYCKHEMPGDVVVQEYMASSLNRLAAGLTDVIPDALWVSRRDRLIHADSKPRQLVEAAKLGFVIPETRFVSSEAVARDFLAKQGECVVKPLAIRPPAGYNQYTVVLRHSDAPSLRGLNVNPHIFQELIKPDYELRVTIVGDQAFASKVADTAEGSSGAIRDWRHGCEHDTFQAEPYELPDLVARQCVQLAHNLGLLSGMIDLIVKDGVYYFLEINGNGQWAFVDAYTVGQIGRALAALLERGRL
jgi:hypothetical protein